MHMADALVSPPVAATAAVASFAVGGYCVYKLKKENSPEKVPLMGIMGAFVFAAQMINFSIPVTGSSGHLCGGAVACCTFRFLWCIYINDGYIAAAVFAFC